MHLLKSQSEKDLIATFLNHVHASPNCMAVITSETSWTYQALFIDVCAWKNRFQGLGVDTPVIVCLHRTPRLISILLALQWLEIAYIPIEPQMPLERIRAIVEDSQSKNLLHDTAHHQAYMSLSCKVHALNELEQTDDFSSDCFDGLIPDSNATAYVIYTSGSTGTPKGVCVSRRALNNFLSSMSRYFLNKKEELLLATTTLTFDIAALELFLPIWQGKTLFLASQAEHKDPLCIQQLLQTHPVTLLQGTPSFWNMLHYAGWYGKQNLIALCGGEPLTRQTADNILPNVSALWNMYGPTEATIWCALKQIKAHTRITVGRPIDNMDMWILDAAMRPLPPGVKGELYISGIGLAEGYINRESLTKERFVTYKQALGKRVYRTGDIACMTPEGEFILFGRVDNQVKLHGYRIELEDVEAHIQNCPGVRECGVLVYQEQLIAYICKARDSDYSEVVLNTRLACELPEFMIPKRFIYLKSLPLNSSGKLNRKALPLPRQEVHPETDDLTPMQAILITIWREALNISSMGIHDNFFELGGHSLLAARIIAKVQQSLGKVMTIRDIYRAPSIIDFIDILNAAPDVPEAVEKADEIKVSSWMPLTDFQFVLWMSHLFEPEVKQLNVVGRRRVLGPLNQTALNLALQALVRKHDALSYAVNRFIPIQKRQQKVSIQWLETSLLDENEETVEAYLDKSIQDLSAHQSWRKQKPLIIAKLFYLSQGRVELQIAMPHMISDQQSLGIFFQDLSYAYLFYSREATAEVPVETKAFESYARHEHQHVHASLKADEVFWKTYLEDAALFCFPKRHVVSKPEKQKHSYSTFFPIAAHQLKRWRAFCIDNAVTLNDLLCAAIGATLHYSCEKEINVPEQLFINTVKSTREDPCFDEVIGCFLRTQAIKLDLTGEKSMVHLAKQVQQSVLETASHQYASSLIKLASIGQLSYSNKRVKPLLIALAANIFGNLRKQPYYLSSPILNACRRLASLDRERGFVVNVNIWDSFFGGQKEATQRLFGSTCEPVPLNKEDIFTINDVLDVCLLRDVAQDKSFLVLSANLRPEFREHLGQNLLNVLG
ncbi:MAG: amino acid adenylation domain-containing protein [Legionellaceae bacterium]|nr:amino acid adenylation domain-containing protein [Legionellaceae bacterium]